MNLIDIIPLHLLQDITVQLQFGNIKNESEIFINDIYILTQNHKNDIIYHDMTQENIISYNTALNFEEKLLVLENLVII